MRVKEDSWLKVEEFAQSSKTDDTVTFTLPEKDWDKLEAYPEIRDKVLTLRLIKVLLPTGETEILGTSLLDQEFYPQEEFGDLYHIRWNQEEGYKLLKSRIEVERFSGKTALAVKQDFHAKILLLTLTSVYSHTVQANRHSAGRISGVLCDLGAGYFSLQSAKEIRCAGIFKSLGINCGNAVSKFSLAGFQRGTGYHNFIQLFYWHL